MFKKKEAARVREYRFKKKMSEQLQVSTAMSTLETTPSISSAFSTKQILSQSVRKTERLFPSSPRKNAEVTGTFAKIFNLRIAVHNKSERKNSELSEEEEEEWIENFLERSGITYTTSGRRDTVYVGMDAGKRGYNKKRYLLWELRDLLKTINGSKIITNENIPSFTKAFVHELSFSQCITSSKCIRKWLTTVTSHTLPVYVKSAKAFHF